MGLEIIPPRHRLATLGTQNTRRLPVAVEKTFGPEGARAAGRGADVRLGVALDVFLALAALLEGDAAAIRVGAAVRPVCWVLGAVATPCFF